MSYAWKMATIKTSSGATILVDDVFTPLLSFTTWFVSSHGYACGAVGHKKILLHRFIMGAKKDDVVDHINNNKLDNRRENLRFATKGQNSQNARKAIPRSGFIGVSYDKGGYIKAGIKIHGKRRHIGAFKTELAAAKAYDKEAVKLFGPEARTNLKHFKNLVLELSREEPRNKIKGACAEGPKKAP